MIRKSTLNQAVILCGGLGTRLRPLTDNLPKPMVLVNGRPFLHHLLEQLSGQGLSRFVLLTGYIGEKVSDYFGDGSQFGWSITYSMGPIEWDTGRRVWESRAQLDAQFLLLYSDNFIQFNLLKLEKLHEELATPVSLLLAPKLKGNIKVSEDGHILAYDKNRNGEGFDFVEVGYMVIERDEILKDFPDYLDFPDSSFSAVLQKLAQQQKIAGLVVRDAYHSISDPERLALMSDYLTPKKILLIDRDGTMNEKASRGQYIGNWGQFKWIPETREVWFAEKIRVELAAYVAAHKPKQLTQPLFYTQRSEGFTANTLTHIVNGIYKHAGISGATSHSGRRTGLTNLAERGVGVRVLMALAG